MCYGLDREFVGVKKAGQPNRLELLLVVARPGLEWCYAAGLNLFIQLIPLLFSMPSFHGLSYISSCKFYCIPSHSWLGSFTSRTRPAAISSSASFNAANNPVLEKYLSAPLIFFCRYNFVCLSFARLNNNSLIIGHGQVLLEYKMGSLIISAKEAAIINTSNSPNCPLRLGVMCRQRRDRSTVSDCSPEVELMNGLHRW